MEDVHQETELYDNLTEIFAASKRARDLVKQILTFSRKGEQERKPVFINSLIVDNLKMLRSTIPSNIMINEQISFDPIMVHANASQLNQVVLNLVTNAVHAIKDNGLIDIGLDLVHLEEKDVDYFPDMIPGSYAKLFVSDTGCGISKDNLTAVFDPYFTTKLPDKGTGLGLAVVHGIVKVHGGHITVYSELDKGTTFSVYLPVGKLPLHKPVMKPESKHTQGSEHILFVDDEPTIAKLQKRVLEKMGYTVTVKTSSVDALKTFRLSPDLFDLLITDMTMPEMTGDKLSQAVKNIRPDIPVIMCTGFSEIMSEKTAAGFALDRFLMKPIDSRTMGDAVRTALDKI